MDKSRVGDRGTEDEVPIPINIKEFAKRDSERIVKSAVERCFTDCVDTFNHKTLEKEEVTCVSTCARKFLKHSLEARRVILSEFKKEHNQETPPGEASEYTIRFRFSLGP